jgi:hypothetical protein
MNEPVASRPHVPGYGISQSLDGLLSWSEVEKSLEAARSYWLVTTSVDGSPHSRPVDGIWLDGVLYFGVVAPGGLATCARTPARRCTSRALNA